MKTRTLLLLLSLLVCYMGTSEAQPKKRAFPVDSENAPDPRIKLQADPPPDPITDIDNPVPITGLEYLLLSGCALGLFGMKTKKSRGVELEE